MPLKRNISPDVAQARARVAAYSKRADDDPTLVAARQDLKAARLEDYITRAVSDAPPLTDEQSNRLASLLRVATMPARELRRPSSVDEKIAAGGDV